MATEFGRPCAKTGTAGLQLHPFEIDDRAVIESHLAKYDPVVSDLNFTAMFMWRKFFRTSYAFIGPYLCIVCGSRDFVPYALPPVGPDDPAALADCISVLKEDFRANGFGLVIKNADDDCVRRMGEALPGQIKVVPDRDSSDYIYLTQDLIELAGKKYDGKRNHIKKFIGGYDHAVTLFDAAHCDPDVIDGCRTAVKQWSESHDYLADEAIYLEYVANNELLDNFARLDAKGMAVLVDGKVAGFAIGSMQNCDTAVIHAEKAGSEYNGLYAFLNREFIKLAWADTKYINREEDLGIEGIRKAKLSYNPYKLVDKHIISIG